MPLGSCPLASQQPLGSSGTSSCSQGGELSQKHPVQDAKIRRAAQAVALQARMRYQQAAVSPCTVVENFTCGAPLLPFCSCTARSSVLCHTDPRAAPHTVHSMSHAAHTQPAGIDPSGAVLLCLVAASGLDQIVDLKHIHLVRDVGSG